MNDKLLSIITDLMNPRLQEDRPKNQQSKTQLRGGLWLWHGIMGNVHVLSVYRFGTEPSRTEMITICNTLKELKPQPAFLLRTIVATRAKVAIEGKEQDKQTKYILFSFDDVVVAIPEMTSSELFTENGEPFFSKAKAYKL